MSKVQIQDDRGLDVIINLFKKFFKKKEEPKKEFWYEAIEYQPQNIPIANDRETNPVLLTSRFRIRLEAKFE